MKQQCANCGEPMEKDELLCPHCGFQQSPETQAANPDMQDAADAEPEDAANLFASQIEEELLAPAPGQDTVENTVLDAIADEEAAAPVEKSAETPATDSLSTLYAAPEQAAQEEYQPPVHPTAPRRKRTATKRYRKLRITLLAVALAILLFFAGGMLIARFWPEKLVFDPKVPTALRNDLQQMIASGDALPHAYFYQKDDQLGIPAYRALIPNGWTANGKVSWNYASAQYPALYTLSVFAPENAATMFTVSQMQFAQSVNSGETILDSRASLKQKIDSPKAFAERFVQAGLGMYVPLLTESKDLDPEKTMQKRYLSLLQPKVDQYKQEGIDVKDIKFSYSEHSGTVLYQDVDSDAVVRLILCSYRLETGDGGKKATVDVWQVLGFQACIAPAGKLEQFLPQMQIIAANQNTNQAWLTARQRASDEALRLLQNGKIEDVTTLEAQSAALLKAAKTGLQQKPDYAAPEKALPGILRMEQFTDITVDCNKYENAGAAPIYMGKQWNKVWLGLQGGEDDIILGVKPADYKPAGGLNWNELQRTQ